MPLNEQEIEIVRRSPQFQGLLDHPGWKLVADSARATIVQHWKLLLTSEAKDIERVRGFIEGANFVLEYADAAVREARLVIESDQADRVASFEAERQRQTAARERAQRRSRVGASLD